LTDEDLRELYSMDWRSALSELFEGDDKMQQWQDFCAAPEEEQRRLLVGLNKTARSNVRRALVPQERYDRIDRRVKALLKRGVGRDFVAAFEDRLVQLLYVAAVGPEEACSVSMITEDLEVSKTKGGASVVLNDSMHRLLAHAVCLYHEVQSFTRDCDKNLASRGSKKLIMLWPHNTVGPEANDKVSCVSLDHTLPPQPQHEVQQESGDARQLRMSWALQMPEQTLQQLIAA